MSTSPATLDSQLAKLDSLKLAGMISQEEYQRCKLGLFTPQDAASRLMKSQMAVGMDTDAPTQNTQNENVNPNQTPTNPPSSDVNGPQCFTHGMKRDWSDLLYHGVSLDGQVLYTCSYFSECPNAPMGGAGIRTISPNENNNPIIIAPGMPQNIKIPTASLAQPGDWFCQCGDFNTASNTHCTKCGAPTEAGTMATPGMSVPSVVKPFPMMPMPMPMMGWGGPGRFFSPYGMARGRGVGVKDFSKCVKAQPLGPDTTEEMMRLAFEQYGPIESIALKLDGTPAYGYVNFVNSESVSSAMAARVVQIGMHRAHITCKGGFMPQGGAGYGRGYYEAEPSNGIGLFRLPLNLREDDLWARVKPMGAHSIKMVMKDGAFAGYAFVYFATVDAATAAKDELTGTMIGGQTFDVKYAVRGRGQGMRGRGRWY